MLIIEFSDFKVNIHIGRPIYSLSIWGKGVGYYYKAQTFLLDYHCCHCCHVMADLRLYPSVSRLD